MSNTKTASNSTLSVAAINVHVWTADSASFGCVYSPWQQQLQQTYIICSIMSMSPNISKCYNNCNTAPILLL